MFVETVIAVLITYLLMILAFKFSHVRKFHISVMTGIIIFDLLMPFYLYLNRDWKERLIDGGEIFSFLIWMHLGIVITLYSLYFMQVMAGKKLLAGDEEQRSDHKNQGKGILIARGFILITGALLVEPDTQVE